MNQLRIPLLLLFTIMMPFPSMTTHAQDDPIKPSPDNFQTALIYDDLSLQHDTGPGFPEHPDRLRHLINHLKKHPISKRLIWIIADNQIDPMPWILELHDADYVAGLKQACKTPKTANSEKLTRTAPRKNNSLKPAKFFVQKSFAMYLRSRYNFNCS